MRKNYFEQKNLPIISLVKKICWSDLETDNPYNTYIYKGLPPGPICNPSLNAILYSLYPAKTDYLYFVAFPNGYHKFAATLAEHNLNRIEAGGGGW